MSDSNEMNTNPKHPRLRLPQSGVTAQQLRDEGKPLTTESYREIMADLFLDVVNGRADREMAMTAVAVGNQIVQAAKLELQNREMYHRYEQKRDSLDIPDPLRLASGRSKRKAS